MSVELGFAVVPFGTDNGGINELYYGQVPEGGGIADDLKEGVVFLQTENEDTIPEWPRLSLNQTGIDNVDNETNGAFRALIGGTLNLRYVKLEPRREYVEQLRAAIPNMGTDFRRAFVKVLVENIDEVIREHGSKAALLVF